MMMSLSITRLILDVARKSRGRDRRRNLHPGTSVIHSYIIA